MSYGVSQSEGRRSRAVWRFTSGHFCTFHQMAAGMWVVQITCCKAFLSWEVHAQCQFVPICDVSINLLKVASKNKCIPFLDVFTGVEMCDVHDPFL